MVGKPIPEMLPAWRDTNGNWGKPVDNLQLSLRFGHHEYRPVEPVEAQIVFRNLNPIEREEWSNGQTNGDFQFMLHHGTNVFNYIPPKEVSDDNPRSHIYVLKGHSEHVLFINLRQLFSLDQLGGYSVESQIQVRQSNGKGKTNLTSGTATFQIVEELSPSEIGARNAYAEQLRKYQQRIDDISYSNATPSVANQTNSLH